jgi:hypothetical protein
MLDAPSELTLAICVNAADMEPAVPFLLADSTVLRPASNDEAPMFDALTDQLQAIGRIDAAHQWLGDWIPTGTGGHAKFEPTVKPRSYLVLETNEAEVSRRLRALALLLPKPIIFGGSFIKLNSQLIPIAESLDVLVTLGNRLFSG